MTLEEMKQLEFQKLYIRNKYSKDPKLNFKDLDSEIIFDKLPNKEFNADSKYEQRYIASLLTFDEIVAAFIAFNANAAIINIGNGLDSRKTRIKRENTKWYYVGNEELNSIYENYRSEEFINKDPYDYTWMKDIDRSAPTYLVVIEDYAMYQEKDKFLDLIKTLCNTFENLTIMVENSSKGVLKTNPNYRLSLNVKDYLAQDEDLYFVKSKPTYRGIEIMKWYKIFAEPFCFSKYTKLLVLHKN